MLFFVCLHEQFYKKMFINDKNTSPSDVLSGMFVFIIQPVQTVGYFYFFYFVGSECYKYQQRVMCDNDLCDGF